LESGDVSLNIDSSDSYDKTTDNKGSKTGIKNSTHDTHEKNQLSTDDDLTGESGKNDVSDYK